MIEGLLAIFFIIFVGSIGGLILWKLFDVVSSSIKKKKNMYDEDLFEQMANAFIDHKKETEQRLQHIEAVIAEEKSEQAIPQGKKPSSKSIEIEETNLYERSAQDGTKNTNQQRNR